MIPLIAHPWWVNLTALIPVAAYLFWRRTGNCLSGAQLFFSALFAVAFGFLEAAVVVYLRAASDLLPGTGGKLAGTVVSSPATYQQAELLGTLSNHLLHIEVMRESATMVMLLALALLASSKTRARWAMFLWTFAIWDVVYYVGLWALVRWPASLRETDVLFLIPVPWLAPVWFPIAVSGLMIVAVLLRKRPRSNAASFAEATDLPAAQRAAKKNVALSNSDEALNS
jgi:hypothetical protein